MLSEILYSVGRVVIQSFAMLMIKMDVHWRSVLPAGPVLFAANHPSTTDPILIHLISKKDERNDQFKGLYDPIPGSLHAKNGPDQREPGAGGKGVGAGLSNPQIRPVSDNLPGRIDQPGRWRFHPPAAGWRAWRSAAGSR